MNNSRNDVAVSDFVLKAIRHHDDVEIADLIFQRERDQPF